MPFSTTARSSCGTRSSTCIPSGLRFTVKYAAFSQVGSGWLSQSTATITALRNRISASDSEVSNNAAFTGGLVRFGSDSFFVILARFVPHLSEKLPLAIFIHAVRLLCVVRGHPCGVAGKAEPAVMIHPFVAVFPFFENTPQDTRFFLTGGARRQSPSSGT